MGVSGNFLAVALPGLTKHSTSQNPVNFRACYPIIEKKDCGAHVILQSALSPYFRQGPRIVLGLDNMIKPLTFLL